MTTFNIQQFTGADFTPIIQLLKENNLPWSDIELGKQFFFIAKRENQIVGCIGIEVYESLGMLRSFSITESYKNNSLGKMLYNKLIEYCLDNELQKLYILTTTADKYFEKLGWKMIRRDVVPLIIQNSNEFSSICPSSAACMELSLVPSYSNRIFGEGFNCAQAVFLPFALKAGISQENALKLTTAFGAGMVYRGETCGAITGAMMAIGLNSGRSSASDYNSKDKTYMLINELYKRFQQKHGSILCKELLKLDDTGHESWAKASGEGLFDIQCPLYVKEAVGITEELLKN